jgi:hypothetical protein
MASRLAFGTRTRLRVSTLRIRLSEDFEDVIADNLGRLRYSLLEVCRGPLTVERRAGVFAVSLPI